ncbi:hypothetical protein L7F22_032536 [Adiantum nelumboides]|nr:hypothetical protein [Adiantum nelumboides]
MGQWKVDMRQPGDGAMGGGYEAADEAVGDELKDACSRANCALLLFLQVVRDKRTGKTKGYGFVSFSTPSDLALALKEMNAKYVGNRPIKLRKSTWKERTDMEALSKHKHNKRLKTSKKNILHK